MLDHKFKVFYHLAKNPNTTQVAQELYLSQPAISKNIRELEKELGITLFHREKGRMSLTDAGHYLLAETELLLQKEREISFELDKMRSTFNGTLYLGASTTLSQYVLPGILAGFTTQNPEIKINLTSGNTDQIEKEVLANNIHLAFIEGTPTQPDIHYIPYLRDEIVLVCAAHNPIAESISRKELLNLHFVQREKGSGTYHVIKNTLPLSVFPSILCIINWCWVAPKGLNNIYNTPIVLPCFPYSVYGKNYVPINLRSSKQKD